MGSRDSGHSIRCLRRRRQQRTPPPLYTIIVYIFFKSTADSLLKGDTFTIFGRDRIGHTVHNQKAAQGMMRQNGVSDSIHVGKENVVRKHIFDER